MQYSPTISGKKVFEKLCFQKVKISNKFRTWAGQLLGDLVSKRVESETCGTAEILFEKTNYD